MAWSLRGPRFDFDEDDRPAVGGHDVQLVAMLEPVAWGENFIAPALEKFRGRPLAALAESSLGEQSSIAAGKKFAAAASELPSDT